MAGTRRPPSPDRLWRAAAVVENPQPGRDEPIDVLFRAYYATLLRLALSLLGKRGPAEDAVQHAFVSTYTHWTGLRDADAAAAYLRSAVVNRCRSALRDRQRRRGRPVLLIDVSGSSPEDVAVARTERSLLAGAVGRLPRRQREVVVCRYHLELSVLETAELLDIGVGSVKRHAHRGVEALAQRVDEGAGRGGHDHRHVSG